MCFGIMEKTESPLRIGAAVWQGFTNKCSLKTLNPTNDCKAPGIDAEILGFLLDYLKINYTLIPYENVEWGRLLPDQTWSGLIGEIINGTLDTVSSAYMRNKERMASIEFTFPLRDDQRVFLLKHQSQSFQESACLMLKVFNISVWSLFLISLILIHISLFFIQKWKHDKIQNSYHNFAAYIWKLYSFSHSYSETNQRVWSEKLFLLLCMLVFFFLLSFYQSSLLSQLVTNPYQIPLTGFDDMIRALHNNKYSFVTHSADDDFFERLKFSTESHYVQIRKALEKNPVEVEPNFAELLKKLNKGNRIYPTYKYSASVAFTDQCNVVSFSIPQEATIWSGYIFAKKSRYLKSMHKAIIGLAPFMRRIDIKYKIIKPEKQVCVENGKMDKLPLTLSNTSGALLLLVVGMISGLIAFLFETCRRPATTCTMHLQDYAAQICNQYNLSAKYCRRAQQKDSQSDPQTFGYLESYPEWAAEACSSATPAGFNSGGLEDSSQSRSKWINRIFNELHLRIDEECINFKEKEHELHKLLTNFQTEFEETFNKIMTYQTSSENSSKCTDSNKEASAEIFVCKF